MTRTITAGVASALLMLTASTVALAVNDEDFLRTAIETNLAEIAAGEMAQEKGMSAAVKTYGEELVADHMTANEEATKLATMASVTVSTAPSAEDQAASERMGALSGDEFDREFASHMAMGHEKAIALFEDKADDGDNAVSAFAKATLPTLEKHLATAQALTGSDGTAMAPGSDMSAPVTAATDTGSTAPEAGAPFEGANSFTEDQARDLVAAAGYSDVSSLARDDKGIWRGTAKSTSGDVSIAVDYKGNVVPGNT